MIRVLYNLKLTLGQKYFLKEGFVMYTIGQVSAMFNLPVSTLRYYDKEGFFPNLEKQSGIRRFSKAELDSIRMNSKYKAKNASHYFS